MEKIIEKQIELLKLCNEKMMNFETTPKYGMVEVRFFDKNSECLFSEMIYIDNKKAINNLNALIEKVKNFK